MPQPKNRKSFPFNRPGNYRIHVLGSLDESWSERLGSLRITVCSQKGSRRMGYGVIWQSARSGRTGRVVEQSLRAAPDAAVGEVYR